MIYQYNKFWRLTSSVTPCRCMDGPPKVLSSWTLSCTGWSNCRGGRGRRLWRPSQWQGGTQHCKWIFTTQEIAGKSFDGTVLLKICCRSFENHLIVEFMRFQDKIILWIEDLSNHKYFLVTKITRWLDQPARQTSKKYILSNTNAICKGSNVSATSLDGGARPSMWGL